MCAREVKWANRLMEQSHCYISPFTVKKLRVCLLINFEDWGVWHGCGISVTVNSAYLHLLSLIHLKFEVYDKNVPEIINL